MTNSTVGVEIRDLVALVWLFENVRSHTERDFSRKRWNEAETDTWITDPDEIECLSEK